MKPQPFLSEAGMLQEQIMLEYYLIVQIKQNQLRTMPAAPPSENVLFRGSYVLPLFAKLVT